MDACLRLDTVNEVSTMPAGLLERFPEGMGPVLLPTPVALICPDGSVRRHLLAGTMRFQMADYWFTERFIITDTFQHATLGVKFCERNGIQVGGSGEPLTVNYGYEELADLSD